MSYAFFPGCSMEGTAHDYQKSTVAVSKALGLELPEIPGWTCCGSTSAHQTDHLLSLALPAKNLVAAEGKTVAVGCASCYSRLKTANYEIANDAQTRKTVATVVGKDYDGQTKILHMLEILAHDIGMKKIAETVKQPLKGLKVVTYYGCLLSRPPEVTKFDDPENPTLMDQVLEAAGATILEWPHKTECCGAGYSITDSSVVKKLTREILAMAKAAGADCIATACPLCQLNLDMRQKDTEKASGEAFNLPVFYFTQLLGLAFGISRKDLGLRSLVVSPNKLLADHGISDLRKNPERVLSNSRDEVRRAKPAGPRTL
jgi:heterodisulfide reductase subunit B